jgi:hypothetical protein
MINLEIWPALQKANNVRSDFELMHLPFALDRILSDVKKCSLSPVNWEIIFVGSGNFFLPEIMLIYKLMQNRVKILSVHFVDIMYTPEHIKEIESKIQAQLNMISSPVKIYVNNHMPSESWSSNGRMVIAFSRLIHWASTTSNIAHFLIKNWRHVITHCQTSHIAFLDYFFHRDPLTDEFKVSDFSDVTQPPLERELYRFGAWEDLWTDYVKRMIHPELRKGVLRMQSYENYEMYCAKYMITTPNNMRTTALDMCKLCARTKDSHKRIHEGNASKVKTEAIKERKGGDKGNKDIGENGGGSGSGRGGEM